MDCVDAGRGLLVASARGISLLDRVDGRWDEGGRLAEYEYLYCRRVKGAAILGVGLCLRRWVIGRGMMSGMRMER